MTAAWIMDRRLHELPNLSKPPLLIIFNSYLRVVCCCLGTEMPLRTQATSKGIRGFNAPNDAIEGPRASLCRSSGGGGPRGRIFEPQGSQSSSERKVGTNYGDTRGDYPEVPTATL